MPEKLRNIVAWMTLAQVGLVGALGTGLHGLLGCEHSPRGCRGQSCCVAACCSPSVGDTSACHDCAFCKRRAASRGDAKSIEPGCRVTAADGIAGCDGCAVCDLLGQYQSAHPFALEALSIELVASEATLQLRNAVVTAATRLALSRGPPTA